MGICLDTQYPDVFHLLSFTDIFISAVTKLLSRLSNFVALCVCDSENVRVFDRSDVHQGRPCRAETCSKVEQIGLHQMYFITYTVLGLDLLFVICTKCILLRIWICYLLYAPNVFYYVYRVGFGFVICYNPPPLLRFKTHAKCNCLCFSVNSST